MISLIEIADRLDNEGGKKQRDHYEPVKANEYTVPVFNIVESNAKGGMAKLRSKLSKVLAFINSVEHKRYKDGCTIMPISVTSKVNLSIWENKMGCSRGIEFMIEIGLISVETAKYQFGAYYERDNKSKIYYYYKDNEDKVKEYCKIHNIDPYYVEVNKVYSMDECQNIHPSINISNVRFSPSLRLMKPIELSKSDFEKHLTLCLYINYPSLRFHIIKANEINERYYKNYPAFRIRVQPNFEWAEDGLYVRGIGFRATNSMTNIKKDRRNEIIKAYGFVLEHDVNASVPRMTLSLNSGHWIHESNDIYERIYRVLEPEGECSNEMREAIKKLHMRAYFDTSDKTVGHHIWLNMNQNNIERQDVCDKMEEFRRAVIEAEGGKLYGSDIFYVESCVYLMTLYDLLASGHCVWQVYDCFYSTGYEDQETFDYMISSSVKNNFEEFVACCRKLR